MRSVERLGRNPEIKVVRDGRKQSDADLTDAVRRAGYAVTVIPTQRLSLTLDGLDCSGCRARAQRELRRLTGVKSASLASKTPSAELHYDKRATNPTKIRTALTKAGFPPARKKAAAQNAR